jgi:hypothetical protein
MAIAGEMQWPRYYITYRNSARLKDFKKTTVIWGARKN